MIGDQDQPLHIQTLQHPRLPTLIIRLIFHLAQHLCVQFHIGTGWFEQIPQYAKQGALKKKKIDMPSASVLPSAE